MERFTMPTGEQLVEFAILFNDGVINEAELTNMVALSMCLIERLYENGTINLPTKKEKEIDQKEKSMETTEMSFENWYDIALDHYKKAGFVELPLDQDAARMAFEEGESPEDYIKTMIDQWDGNQP